MSEGMKITSNYGMFADFMFSRAQVSQAALGASPQSALNLEWISARKITKKV